MVQTEPADCYLAPWASTCTKWPLRSWPNIAPHRIIALYISTNYRTLHCTKLLQPNACQNAGNIAGCIAQKMPHVAPSIKV